MNTKTFVSGLAGGVVLFLAGYVVYGLLLMDYFTSNMTSYPGLMKEPMELWAIGLGNIILGILLAYILNLGGIRSASRGASIGAFTFFLIALGINMIMYAQLNMYNLQLYVVDAVCMAILGALAGAVTGWLLGRSPVTNS